MAARMTAALCVNAIEHASVLRGPVDTILHSDRGAQGAASDGNNDHHEQHREEPGSRADSHRSRRKRRPQRSGSSTNAPT